MGAPVAAIVLAGGGSRRLGGADKCWFEVGGRPILESVVAAVANLTPVARSAANAGKAGVRPSTECAGLGSDDRPAIGPIIVVGPRRELITPVHWTREAPAGAGPVAGLQAGLSCLDQLYRADAAAGFVAVQAADSPPEASLRTNSGTGSGGAGRTAAGRIIVLGGDMPFVGLGLEELLREGADTNAGAVIAQDATGRDQYLLAVWRTASLRGVLAAAAPNASLRSLYRSVKVTRRILPAAATLDCDTPAELARARELGLIQPVPD